MAGSTFQTNPFDLSKLLDDCHRGVIQLPDFHRSWVWDEDRIKSLIASVSRAFPIGAPANRQTAKLDRCSNLRLHRARQMPPSSLPSKDMMISSHHRMDKDALVASLFLMDRPHVTPKGNPP
jgi:hypothetical protein